MNNYISTIESLCQDNKYLKIYVFLCLRGIEREPPVVYEKHHILPRSFDMGGNINVENITLLTPKEHFVCHRILAKIVLDKKLRSKMVYALWQFTRRYKINARSYSKLKQDLSTAYTGIPFTNEHKLALRKPKRNSENMGRKKGCSNPFKGKKRSQEVGQKISAAKKGKCSGENNPFFGRQHSIETKKILSEHNTGKKQSKETIDKRNSTRKAKNMPAWNKGINNTEEQRKKASASLSGRITIRYEDKLKRVKPVEIQFWLDQGWSRVKQVMLSV